MIIGITFLLFQTTQVFSDGRSGGGFNLTPYIGFNAGSSKAKNVNTNDDTDTSYRLYGGLNFNRYVGVEIGYANLGEFSSPSGVASWEYTSLYTAVVGKLPINSKFSLTSRLGYGRYDVDGSGIGASRDGSDLVYGIGALYHLNSRVGIALDYMRYDFGDVVENKAFSLGIQYSFNK